MFPDAVINVWQDVEAEYNASHVVPVSDFEGELGRRFPIQATMDEVVSRVKKNEKGAEHRLVYQL
jgi:hypothetical protein